VQFFHGGYAGGLVFNPQPNAAVKFVHWPAFAISNACGTTSLIQTLVLYWRR
jgi:hypothetical protein